MLATAGGRPLGASAIDASSSSFPPSRATGRYQQAHSRAPPDGSGARLLDLNRPQIEQRIVAVAIARAKHRHAGDPASQQRDRARCACTRGLTDEDWASAVEQERIGRIQRLSALRYGRPIDEVEVAIRRRLGNSLAATESNDGGEKEAT